MNCPRCTGLVVYSAGEHLCVNCGNRPLLIAERLREEQMARDGKLCWYCRTNLKVPGKMVCQPCIDRDRRVKEKDIHDGWREYKVRKVSA